MFQLCLCGSPPSYPHAPDCPYPCFSRSSDEWEKWDAARFALADAQAEPGHDGERYDRDDEHLTDVAGGL